MSNRPLVAILTPAYNAAKYLEATMKCVQAQTYPNLVHIIIDNASTDATAEIIDRYKDGRVPVISKRNPATVIQVDNWNIAAANTPADAKYVQWLCADDLIRADAIEKMVELAETDPSIAVVGAMDVYNDRIHIPVAFEPGQTVLDGRAFARVALAQELRWFPYQAFFIRTEAGRFDETAFSRESTLIDQTFILKFLGSRPTNKVGFVWEPLIYTRVHEGTVTSARTNHQPSMHVIHIVQHMDWYGPAALGSDLPQAKARATRKLIRHRLARRMRGDTENVALVDRHFRTLGIRPTLLETMVAVLEWPLHRWRDGRLADLERKRGYGRPVTEREFLKAGPT